MAKSKAAKAVSEIVNRPDIPVRSCRPHPRNYQSHPPEQIAELRRSLKMFGQVASLVVQGQEGGEFLLVAGHGVHLAMLYEGYDTLRADVIPSSWPEVKVFAYLAADNELARQADPDQAQLAVLVADVKREADDALAQLAAGSEKRMEELLVEAQRDLLDPTLPGDDPGPLDPSEALLANWPVELGQVWEIASRSVPGAWHRLRCGDSSDRLALAKLLAGARADWMWTDPPYGVEYVGKTKDALTIEGDALDLEALEALLSSCFAGVNVLLEKGAPIYIAHSSGPNSEVFFRTFREVGWHLHQDLVWVKQTMILGHSDYHYEHENILYGWQAGAEAPWYRENGEGEDDGDHYPSQHGFALYGWKPGKRRPWFGGRTRVSVFYVQRPTRSSFHLTAKPPELIAKQLMNSSKVESLGIDPFCGWGSTMVAAERTGRVCFAQEIAPKFCASTLERLAMMGLSVRLAEDADGERLV